MKIEPNGLVRVRMRRAALGYTQAVDLRMDEVYELLPDRAAQLIADHGAVPADDHPEELEAAALRTARRRG